MPSAGHVVVPGTGGHDDLPSQAIGLHSSYNCVVLGEHCEYSIKATTADGVKLKPVLHVVPQMAREAGLLPASLFPGKRNSF